MIDIIIAVIAILLVIFFIFTAVKKAKGKGCCSGKCSRCNSSCKTFNIK